MKTSELTTTAVKKDVSRETINEAVKELIKKKTKWDNPQISQFFDQTRTINKTTIYEMICEIEGIATYAEIAQVFADLTDLPYCDAVVGDIIDINKGRHIEAIHNGLTTYYIWHPLAVKGIPPAGRIAFLSRDVFTRLTCSCQQTVSLNAKDRVIEIFRDAVKQHATDIHLFPMVGRGVYKLSFRILGELHDMDTLEYDDGKGLVSMILNWAKEFTPSLRVDDVRKPQDGRIEITSEQAGKDLDVRVSIIYKQNMKDADIVMRLLYKGDLTDVSLESLGFSERHSRMLKTVIVRNRGIVIVTGATGTGKSKTVNTLLSMVSRSKNILTVEDPIEYHLQHGRQFQTLEWEGKEGICATSFSEFARAFKRQDPDVIFIGELRDKETVDTAFHLAKTGHLVFTTLHASRATMVPEILIEDYQIASDVVADNLLLAANQVLVKRLCDKCKKEVEIEAPPEWLNALRFTNVATVKEFEGKKVYVAHLSPENKCPTCRMTSRGRLVSVGYSGRTLISEIYEFSPQCFKGGLSSDEMEDKLPKFGNILDDAIEKVLAGVIEIGALRGLL
ncbi:MAG: GspE/PulE family protein [Thermodesulfovibrionales bacterium]